MIIPLVFAMAGNATWFVYLLATVATLLVGYCVSRFARLTASPGSLYTYAADTLPPVFGACAAWGLLMAYLASGASAAGGTLYFAVVLSQQFFHFAPPAIPLLTLLCAVAALIAYRDVKLSADLMLWIEIVSVGLILIVLAVMPIRFGLHFDIDQLRLKGVSISALGPAMVLSMLSFVGFESATALGVEARQPLRTIPRVVLQCAILSGVFFMICSYSEVLGFRGEPGRLSDSTSPLHLLAAKAGIAPLGVAVDFGAMMSMFACVLACMTAAARVLLTMSHHGLTHAHLTRTHHRNETPHIAVLVTAVVTFVVTIALAVRGVSGSDIYGWMGSLATYGFLTAYALVCLAVPSFLKKEGALTPLWMGLAGAGFVAMLLAIAGSVYPVPTGAYRWLPYIYLSYLIAGWVWTVARKRVPVTVT
jgi:amino acid transporter